MSRGEKDLDAQMRAVLVQLMMTSNGSTAKMDGNTGGGSARHYADTLLVGWLDPLDAPHQRYLDLYMREVDDVGRAKVVALAKDELDRIRYSRGHEGELAAETLEDLFDRIVAAGEGWSVRDVAVHLRTSDAIVRRARRERGRDQEKGKPVEDSSGLGRDERRRRVLKLKDLGRSSREIAHALGVPYSTVLRDLGRKT
jgi:hypothetical protein